MSITLLLTCHHLHTQQQAAGSPAQQPAAGGSVQKRVLQDKTLSWGLQLLAVWPGSTACPTVEVRA